MQLLLRWASNNQEVVELVLGIICILQFEDATCSIVTPLGTPHLHCFCTGSVCSHEVTEIQHWHNMALSAFSLDLATCHTSKPLIASLAQLPVDRRTCGPNHIVWIVHTHDKVPTERGLQQDPEQQSGGSCLLHLPPILDWANHTARLQAQGAVSVHLEWFIGHSRF